MAATFENENTVFRMAQAGKTAELDREYEAALAKLRTRVGQAHPMIIGGKEVGSARTFETRDPSTGEVLAKFPIGTAADVDAAVKAAKAAQPAWEKLGWEKRAAVFERAAAIMRERRPELAALMTLENGKNRVEAYYDVDEAIDFLKYYAWQMREHQGYVVPMGKPFPDETCVSVLRPWGVFAVVGPFNFPVAIPTGMTVGALVTGNAVVLKPASDTPWCAAEVVRVLHDAGVPRDLPWKKDADMGPVINEAAVKTFEAAVAEAKKAGGQVLAGGNVRKDGDLAKGHFVEPTIVAGLPHSAQAFRTEYFVPFLAVARY